MSKEEQIISLLETHNKLFKTTRISIRLIQISMEDLGEELDELKFELDTLKSQRSFFYRALNFLRGK